MVDKKQKFRRSLQGTNGEEFHLQNFLWESSNILRNIVDASDFKAYIFPLLFYKRISDVYDEEYQKALDESDGDSEYAKSDVHHRFQIPDGCHWNDLRKQSKNIGQYLQKSLRSLEKTNPDTLYRIFGDTNWGNKGIINDELMVNLVEHFSKVTLSNSKIKEDFLGDSYEYLIKKFADEQNKSAGEFYTPRSVVNLLVKILDPNDNQTIYDPACGTGGMLLETASHIKKKGQDVRKLKLYGQESNLNTAAIARINLFLHGIDNFKIIRGDTLRAPAFTEKDHLKEFDCVIANPPFSLKRWGYETWGKDPFGRNIPGMPPKSFGDFAWVEHMISSIKEKGKVGMVISTGALFRPFEKNIRKYIIDNDLLVTIIQLGDNIFYGSSIGPSILIFKKQKMKHEKEKILFINASRFFEIGKAQNFLLQNHIDDIFQIIQERKNIDNISKVVSKSEIIGNKYNLNIELYVKSKQKSKIMPLIKTATSLKNSILELQKSEKILLKSLMDEFR